MSTVTAPTEDAPDRLEARLKLLEEAVAQLIAAQRASSAPGVYRIRDMQRVTGLSRATIYRKEAAGELPRRFPLGDGSVGWDGSEVDRVVAQWKERLPITRRESRLQGDPQD